MSIIMIMLRVVVATALIALSVAAPAGDFIKSLPGFGVPPTKQYSGFIPADDAGSVYLHYWFVESASNPATDPVVIWMNGGPGCSSLEGYYFELGPFKFNGSTLAVNQFGWNQISNVLFLEHPAGVGFSYNVNNSFISDDYIQSQNTYNFLLNWYKAFPEYGKNDLYIMGESYAGIYVPTLANRIRLGTATIPLKGFAVGNGCVGSRVGSCSIGAFDEYPILLEFFHGHHMIAQNVYNHVKDVCGNYSDPLPECEQTLVAAVTTRIGNINVYNVYDTCGDDSTIKPFSSVIARAPSAALKNLKDPIVCVPFDYLESWLNDPDVRAAIHMDKVNLTTWSDCTTLEYGKYIFDILPLYPDLIKAYRVLIYSGDADACIPHYGSEEWTRGLGITVSKSWHSFYVTSGGSTHVGGYVTNYANGFQYVSIKHAGHMVPQYEPETAFYMFKQWINNEPI